MSGKLHIEVIRNATSKMNSKVLFTAILKELKERDKLVLGDRVTEMSEMLREHLTGIQVCELEYYGEGDTRKLQEGDSVSTGDVSMCLHVYRLNKEGSQLETIESNSEESEVVVVGHCWELPALEFHDLWDNLVFDSDIKHRLLNYGRAMLSYSMRQVDPKIISSNRVILLHGPPGTGKTTLCKALAQKLSVRLSSTFDSTIFLEINTHSLLSKYFSESGKLVTKMFRKIGELLEDPTTLVCLLIDEVESLAHSRANATSGVEPSDSFRVVNSVLTQLDLIKTKPNVLVLATSNISKAIDVAFVDRADISQFIPNPSPFAVYTILYSCLQELLRVEMITGPLPEKLRYADTFMNASSSNNIDETQRLLINLSYECSGLSGRSLRKIPLLAHSFYLNPNLATTPDELIKAMHSVIVHRKSELESSVEK